MIQNNWTNLEDLYHRIEKDMNADLKRNGFKNCGIKIFRSVVKNYWRTIMNRVVYLFDEVELWNKFGTLGVRKILCTEFNPENIDVNKTDGYFYFIFWNRPLKYMKMTLKACGVWKKRAYQNVVFNGKDYPEIIRGQYVTYVYK